MMSNYIPPKVWRWEQPNGGAFAAVNRPISGATFEQPLSKGEKGLQLYSLGTPNGVKVAIMLEELLALGKSAEYDLFTIDIRQGDQFGSGFVGLNPNSKIPALLDLTIEKPLPIFESGAILLYLAEKFEAFLPTSIEQRTACLSWLFWQMASAPYVGCCEPLKLRICTIKTAKNYPIKKFLVLVVRLDKNKAL